MNYCINCKHLIINPEECLGDIFQAHLCSRYPHQVTKKPVSCLMVRPNMALQDYAECKGYECKGYTEDDDESS